MKRILLSAVTLLSVSLSAQVGINTTEPQSTLDVNGDFKVSTNLGRSNQKDVLTVLENGKVGVNIKDFKNNSSNEAVLQVGGLIQSKTIRNANDRYADKIVVVNRNGVMKTIEKSSLDYGNDISSLRNELTTLKTKSNSISSNTRNINDLLSRLSRVESKLASAGSSTTVGNCPSNAILTGLRVGGIVKKDNYGNGWTRASGPYLCACLDPTITGELDRDLMGVTTCSKKIW